MVPTIQTLAQSTSEMREAQRNYFKVCRDPDRKGPALLKSKAAEARVDLLLAQFRMGETETLTPPAR